MVAPGESNICCSTCVNSYSSNFYRLSSEQQVPSLGRIVAWLCILLRPECQAGSDLCPLGGGGAAIFDLLQMLAQPANNFGFAGIVQFGFQFFQREMHDIVVMDFLRRHVAA